MVHSETGLMFLDPCVTGLFSILPRAPQVVSLITTTGCKSLNLDIISPSKSEFRYAMFILPDITDSTS